MINSQDDDKLNEAGSLPSPDETDSQSDPKAKVEDAADQSAKSSKKGKRSLLSWIPLQIAFLLSAAVTWTEFFANAPMAPLEDRLFAALRMTGVISFLFFIVVYTARPLFQMGATSFRPLVRYRRQVGLAAALAHAYHTVFVGVLLMDNSVTYDASALVYVLAAFGLFAYMLMALTSNDASQRFFGMDTWKLLHTICLHYIWVVYLAMMVLTALDDLTNPTRMIAIVMLFNAFLIRAICYYTYRKPQKRTRRSARAAHV